MNYKPLDLKQEVIFFAKNYHLEGDYKKICFHNAEIAERLRKFDVAKVWR